jgi:[acyl-carrier-protein] S-malonyltransferase
MASAGGAKRAVMLAVSAPFHSALMLPAQQRLEADLRATTFHSLRVPLVTNVDAEITSDGDEARDSLVRQVTLPVRWEESVRVMVEEGVNTFVEVGPGRVLAGLLRQIDRSVHVFNVEDEKSLHLTLEKLAQAQTEAAEA